MKPTWKVLLVLFFASIGCNMLHAQPTDADRKLFEETKIKAEAGDAPAQYDLGCLYKSGRGVAKDAVAYQGWVRKSAEHGFAQAQVTLADLLSSDTNSPNNKAEALAWLTKAADQDYALGQFMLGFEYYRAHDYGNALVWLNKAADKRWYAADYQLGMMYLDGKGVEKDYQKAYSFFYPAALAGNSGAQYMLCYMYAGGLGRDKDLVQAYKWGYICASQGNKYSQKGLEDLRKIMTADQLNQANELIRKFTEESAATEISAAPTPAAVSTEKQALIEKMFALTGAKSLMEKQLALIIPISKKSNPEIPDEFWRRFAQKMNIDDLSKQIYPIYDKYFTAEDLKAFIAFYETPAGQKMAKTLPLMMQEMTTTCSQWGAKVGKEVEAELGK
ncbi:MAG: DUF2059 domain-containing protein [Formivibrio sp.]|nr:DUF2059 domain-containing protein [Formivibrio sp.]